jgi:hypothetical protein
MLTIKTNHQFRDFTYRYDVPASVLADQFDHLSEDDVSDSFVQYRGHWYHTSDFIRTHDSFPGKWDGYTSDSFFSGVLIRLSRDGERCQLATYYADDKPRMVFVATAPAFNV